MSQGNASRVIPATTAEKIRELAEQLHRGIWAIREGRVDATIHDLVVGALRCMHAEAAAMRPERRAHTRSKRRTKGLCVSCGQTEAIPRRRYCAQCLLRERVQTARRKGQIPHVRHPAPKEETRPWAGAGLPPSWEGRESA